MTGEDVTGAEVTEEAKVGAEVTGAEVIGAMVTGADVVVLAFAAALNELREGAGLILGASSDKVTEGTAVILGAPGGGSEGTTLGATEGISDPYMVPWMEFMHTL